MKMLRRKIPSFLPHGLWHHGRGLIYTGNIQVTFRSKCSKKSLDFLPKKDNCSSLVDKHHCCTTREAQNTSFVCLDMYADIFDGIADCTYG